MTRLTLAYDSSRYSEGHIPEYPCLVMMCESMRTETGRTSLVGRQFKNNFFELSICEGEPDNLFAVDTIFFSGFEIWVPQLQDFSLEYCLYAPFVSDSSPVGGSSGNSPLLAVNDSLLLTIIELFSINLKHSDQNSLSYLMGMWHSASRKMTVNYDLKVNSVDCHYYSHFNFTSK